MKFSCSFQQPKKITHTEEEEDEKEKKKYDLRKNCVSFFVCFIHFQKRKKNDDD